MDRGTSSYAPLTRHRVPRRPRLFKSVRLNAIGWLALVGACLLSGAVFAVVGYLIGISWVAPAVIGVFTALVVLVILDRRRHGAGWANYSWTDDESEKATVVVALRATGVEAQLDSWNGEPPFAVHIHRRDEKSLNRILDQLGIAPFEG